MIRFHVVVFNFERINSFLSNFDKVVNFDPLHDRILIFDCSRNWRSQKNEVANFAQQQGWTLGKQIQFLRRRNWGIDQGARIEYLQSLHNQRESPRFVWQFQEHYLDLKSPWSIWEDDKAGIAGQLKADTIPDNVKIDLDFCETVYEQHPDVSVIYADRNMLGVFKDSPEPWFYADGANFSVRTSHALKSLTPKLLASYKMSYDASYHWTLFVELDICRRLTRTGVYWYDLVTGSKFDSLATVRAIESETHRCLHQEAEEFYGPLYYRYEARLHAALARSSLSREMRSKWTHAYWTLTQSAFIQKTVKPLIAKLGISAPGQLGKKYLLSEDAKDLLK